MKSERKLGTTHFGFQEVPVQEKARKVAAIFDSIAPRYDLMNDITSFGMHRLWRRFALKLSGVGPGQRVLDLAGGTGDFSARLARLVGSEGKVVIADVNGIMLLRGRTRLVGQGLVGNVEYVQADAEGLPFADEYFDCVTIAFGLRNMTDQDAALVSVFRVLKPGRPVIILEFSHPTPWGLALPYDLYSFTVLPLLGRVIANNGSGYRYLPESIRTHPDQETLREMMEEAGFERCEYFNLAFGIVAVHRGHRRN
jgi:demethylmenaquinone methyltransferase/2-methoxy-6-polyprenyl-1,4-benzoquinol methylase